MSTYTVNTSDGNIKDRRERGIKKVTELGKWVKDASLAGTPALPIVPIFV